MPRFAQIELFLDGTYTDKEKDGFIFKSRCICNYLEGALAERDFESTRSRVNIFCSRDEGEVRVHPLKSPPFLEVCIKYDLPPLAGLDEASLQGHYTKIIDLGLRATESFMAIPHSYCMSILQEFREGGFKNEWVHVEKEWQRLAIRSEVVARLTTEEFTLWQYVYRDGHLIAEKLVATTKPREGLFFGYFGKLSRERSGNIVYKRKDKVFSRFDVESGKFIDLNPWGF